MSQQEARNSQLSIKVEDKEDSANHSIEPEQDAQFSQPQVKLDNCNQMNDDQVNEDQPMQGEANGSLPLIKKRTHRKSDISTFIMKTYKILDQKRNADIVQWADEGNCFIVKNKDRFENEILPKYFKHRKFSSFVRQLNMYDFHKIRKEKQIPIFRHKYFKQGAMDLLHKIKRKSGQQIRDEQGSQLGHTITNVRPSQMSIQNEQIQRQGSLYFPKSSQQVGPINSIYPHSIYSNQNGAGYSVQGQIDMLSRQNAQFQHNIAEISHEINNLQISKDRKKQKLMKIISAMMFFELKSKSKSTREGTEKLDKESQQNDHSLRKLQEHFIKDEEPWSFTEYSQQLSQIYQFVKSSIV